MKLLPWYYAEDSQPEPGSVKYHRIKIYALKEEVERLLNRAAGYLLKLEALEEAREAQR